jgi:predicted ATPase/DNA-binding XRE family transcriptional regulator
VKESGRSRFGELLREFRLAVDLSQEQLAERARISVDAVGALERGVHQAPHRETLQLLIDALDLSPEQKRAIEGAAKGRSRPRAAPGPVRSNLQLAMTPFFGRAREIEEITEMFDRFPLITLTGAGGVGKTRLAMRVGADCIERFPDGVWFVDLAPLHDSNRVPYAVASVLSISESPRRPLTDAIIDAVRTKRVLLIIDNCEHLLEAATFVEALARAGRDMRILATSRQPLGIAGEKTYRLASLDMPSAVELFAECARRVTQTFDMTSENREDVGQICRELDGIPLAIELAAARLRVLDLEQLEERLAQRLLLLTGGSRLALPRHQTMRALIDWSYDLLAGDEKALLARLVVFPSSFSLEAASAVCHDDAIDRWNVFELLTSLVDKSLVINEEHGGYRRYRLLEIIRIYASELAGTGELERLCRRHAEYYASFAERAEERFATAPSTLWWSAGLEPDIENMRTALDWALKDRNDVEVGVRLLVGSVNFWLIRGLAAEGARRAEDAINAASMLPPALQAALWLTFAQMRGELFAPAQTLAAARRACELFEQLHDNAQLGRALRSRGVASMRLGRFDAAEPDLYRALELSRTDGQRQMTRALASVGVFLQVSAQLMAARDALTQALNMAQDSGDDRVQWVIALNLAECEFGLGDIPAAIGHATKNLATDFLRANVQLRSNQEGNLAAYLIAAHRRSLACGATTRLRRARAGCSGLRPRTY